jgi:hypothetical protein
LAARKPVWVKMDEIAKIPSAAYKGFKEKQARQRQREAYTYTGV